MNGLPEIQYSKSIMTGSRKEKKLWERAGAESIAAYKPGSSLASNTLERKYIFLPIFARSRSMWRPMYAGFYM